MLQSERLGGRFRFAFLYTYHRMKNDLNYKDINLNVNACQLICVFCMESLSVEYILSILI